MLKFHKTEVSFSIFKSDVVYSRRQEGDLEMNARGMCAKCESLLRLKDQSY